MAWSARQRPSRTAALKLGYLVLLAVVLLAPLDFHTPNRARFQGAEGLDFTRPGIARSPAAADKLRQALADSGRFSLELWAQPTALDQRGPARIVSYSAGIGERNFTVGQDLDALIVRLRTGATDLNGTDREVRIERAFRLDRPQHIVITYDSAHLAAHIDGQPRGAAKIDGDLTSWSPWHPLVLGNEASGDRPWRGRLSFFAAYDVALSPDAIEARYRLGVPRETAPGETPEPVVVYRLTDRQGGSVRDDGHPPHLDLKLPRTLEPRRTGYLSWGFTLSEGVTGVDLAEAVLNVIIFIPFGFLIFSTLHQRAHALVATLLVVLMVPLAVESFQHLLVSRYSQAEDAIFNASGGVIGLILARRGVRAHR